MATQPRVSKAKVVGEEVSRQQRDKKTGRRLFRALEAIVKPSASTLSEMLSLSQRNTLNREV